VSDLDGPGTVIDEFLVYVRFFRAPLNGVSCETPRP
jgi:hypothetical protein